MRARRFGLLVLVLALILGAASLLAGCGSSEAGGVKTYNDATYGFSFDYPGDWQLSSSESAEVTSGADPTEIVTVGDPKGTMVGDTGVDLIMVRVYELNQVITEDMLPQVLPVLEALVTDFQTQDPTFKIEQPLTLTDVGGVPGYEVTGTFDQNADTPMKTTFYFLFAGSIEYQLVVQASASTWQADQVDFAAFLASFAPGETKN